MDTVKRHKSYKNNIYTEKERVNQDNLQKERFSNEL